ncbi:MAG TPA: acyl-CoA dehydrogenase family protein, partial [Anaerolineae bacterium]|nr:acyl-CoA dehydrogenase family protein [Anaerolineae bacterium]
MVNQLVTLSDPRSPAAEAYRSLYINLSFSGQERPIRSLLVVSPGPDEGKSVTLANLAVVAAQMGQQVVLVDCDLRQPQQHELFSLRNDAGVATVIAAKGEAASALQAVADVPGLKVLTSGPVPVSPTQVLASRSMETLLNALVENADLVLVCCKTDTEVQPAWKGVSIVLVEADRAGFKRGRNLDKVGLDAADTSELFFEDVRVPITNCLGEEGKGFI